jgi:hypothetical protein
MLRATTLSRTTGLKRGVVVIRHPDGTFKREIQITAEDYRALGEPGAGPPPGVTAEEWNTPGTAAFGMNLAVGDVEVDGDTALILLDARPAPDGRGPTLETYLRVRPGEWSGADVRALTVAPSALQRLPADRRPLAISLGVVVW